MILWMEKVLHQLGTLGNHEALQIHRTIPTGAGFLNHPQYVYLDVHATYVVYIHKEFHPIHQRGGSWQTNMTMENHHF